MSTTKNTLVTGAAGFIGSNFVQYFVANHKDHYVVLDKLTYAGDPRNLEGLEQADNYTFEQGDICDAERLQSLFDQYQFSQVIHFAAESHVDNSITGPGAFVQTNIVGTFELLQAAYKLWMTGPQALREVFAEARFLHVSTDEVYGHFRGFRAVYRNHTLCPKQSLQRIKGRIRHVGAELFPHLWIAGGHNELFQQLRT